MYEAKVLCDSIAQDVRLVTLQVTMPRIVLAEFNTHRMFSRNSASSRAIPVAKRIAEVEANPFIPEAFMANQKGMQAGEPLDYVAQEQAKSAWIAASKSAIKHAKILAESGVHKQWSNRVLEPFMGQTVIVSATEWENFYNLRISPEAQPEIRITARAMREAMNASTPVKRLEADWHLPFISEEDIEEACKLRDPDAFLVKLSVARCARVSYLTHDKATRDLAADVALHDKLLTSGHMSCFEHQARVHHSLAHLPLAIHPTFVGNFRWPWIQYRKDIANEAVFRGVS